MKTTPNPRQIKLAKIIKENISSPTPCKSMGELMRQSGYSEQYSRNPKCALSTEFVASEIRNLQKVLLADTSVADVSKYLGGVIKGERKAGTRDINDAIRLWAFLMGLNNKTNISIALGEHKSELEYFGDDDDGPLKQENSLIREIKVKGILREEKMKESGLRELGERMANKGDWEDRGE